MIEQRYIFNSFSWKRYFLIFGLLNIYSVYVGIKILMVTGSSGILQILLLLSFGIAFVISASDRIIICRDFIQIRNKKYSFSTIRCIRLAEIRSGKDKWIKLLLEFNQPVTIGNSIPPEFAENTDIRPENTQMFSLENFSYEKRQLIVKALTHYKMPQTQLEVDIPNDIEA